jgi:diaminohydroxyphosphoribosylaminopyrimidine deaminase/5-amino-6-(5-phosphoribosylamino)uracil reductase
MTSRYSSTFIFLIAFRTPAGLPSLISGRASTAELRPRTANPAGSPARPTSCIAIACGRSPTLSSSVARTVRADDPQLTVRRCAGDNAFRVVIDPELSLTGRHAIFRDRAAPTLIVAAKEHADRRGETHGCEILGVPRVGGTLDVSAIRTALGDRGLSVVFVEGGGITISHFLEAGCLNRLQITVAPIIIGSGRPGVAFPGDRPLDRALRPRIRRFDLGGDTLFDCDFDA